MEQESHAQVLKSAAQEIGVDLTGSQIDQFMLYLEEMQRWNRKTNLTSITDTREIIIKHFVDSLSVLSTLSLKAESCLCDVGSGAGLPGIPIKITRPDLKVIMVEPNKKKTSFLQSVIGILRLGDITVYSGTFDRYVQDFGSQKIDVLMSRALRFSEFSDDILNLTIPVETLILFRTEPSRKSDLPYGFTLVFERELLLPFGFGKRVLSVLKSVPRGTVTPHSNAG